MAIEKYDEFEAIYPRLNLDELSLGVLVVRLVSFSALLLLGLLLFRISELDPEMVVATMFDWWFDFYQSQLLISPAILG